MDVDNKDKKLLPGMIAEITIPLPAKDSSFLVPKSAVVNASEKVFVVKVEQGKTRHVLVEKGREANGWTEIFGTLSPADTLILNATEETRENTNLPALKLTHPEHK
jgi:multidrug efflux pump subunit AcrA (membrane-fusion protein)